MAAHLIERELSRDSSRRWIAVVLTDGRVTSGRQEITDCARRLGATASAVHVIDVEEGPVRLGLARSLAQAASGEVHTLRAPTAPQRRSA